MNNQSKLLPNLGLALLLVGATIEPVLAETKSIRSKFIDSQFQENVSNQSSLTNQVKPLEFFSQKAEDLLLTQQGILITGVRLNATETGLEIILETATGEANLQPLIFPQDNNLVIDILDVVLALPDGQDFLVENPTADITQVTVKALDATSIRITITGKNNTPSVTVKPSSQDLVLNVTPSQTATTPENQQDIDIVATQEAQKDNYFVPDASIGTGTDTPIIETPFSVQVVPETLIRDQQAIDIQEALNNISSVNYFGNTQGRDASFNIRGFGNPLGSGAPILRDGYRLYGSFQGIPELANLQQVEVLKGPASILYGQIEPGGIINLVSKQPLETTFYEVEVQVGSEALIRPRFDISGPLTDDGRLLYRLNGLYKHEDSFRNFDNPQQRYSIAPVLAWQATEDTNIEIIAEYINDSGYADFGLTQFGDGVAPVSRETAINNPNDTISTNLLNVGYNIEYEFTDNWTFNNSFRYLSNDYNFNVVALPLIVDGANVTRFFAYQEGQDKSYSFYTTVAGEFNTGSIKHKLNTGIDLNRSTSRIASLVDFITPSTINIFDPDYDAVPKPSKSSLAPFGDTTESANRLGVYVQDQVYLLENLIFVAGLRYDVVLQTTSNVGESDTSQTDDAFTPRFGLLYRPIEQLSLFANYSQSFNPNLEVTSSGSSLEPETGEGFEFGIKGEFFEQKLLATLTYFNITKNNVAVADPDFPLFSIAIGEQSSQGIELDIAGEILPGWKVIASYAYIDSTVTEDTNPEFVDNELFGVPNNKVTFWTTYEIQEGALQGLGVGGGFTYAGDRFGDLANSYTVGDYWIGNLAIFYRRDKYTIALNFKNISDNYYIESVTGNDGGIYPGEPFTVIGSFSMRF